MTTAFDKLDYHVDGALRAGQPEEHAFTHMGLYLAWLIRHDLHDPDFVRDDWAAAMKAGEMAGSDLADAIDGVLVSDLMTDEGAAFTATYYDTYLDDYSGTFADEGDYGVPDSAEAYERIAAVVDRRYADWVESGRPASGRPEAEPPPPLSAGFDPGGGPDVERLRSRSMGELEGLAAEEGWLIEQPAGQNEMPHAATDLEDLIPRDITRPPMDTSSAEASQWGDPLLKRALKRLSVSVTQCVVANGISGDGPGVMTATLYAVPNADAGGLKREFAPVIHLPPRSRWEAREVVGKHVQWASTSPFHVAFWTLDGLVVHASAGNAEQLEQLISRLP